MNSNRAIVHSTKGRVRGPINRLIAARRDHVQVNAYLGQARTSNATSATPCTRPVMRSPATTGPTPSGVPV